MKLIYECEKVAILQGDKEYIIHVLNDYRLVKEIIVNKNDLIPTLKKEFNSKKKRKFNFNKKKLNDLDIVNKIKLILN